ncbi:MAG: CaiB/BaiF CoA transferase family protein [Anaerolineales bacterium]
MTGPLAALRVLDFSSLLPGPYATMFLADLGADVIRVEGPQRPDPMRSMQPRDGDSSTWHGVLGRSKRALALDLKNPAAAAVVKRLVQTHDIVLDQFRPGVMDRLGIGYGALQEANPRVIYCALTGYGQTGPYRDRAGHDINYLALAGVASVLGRKEHGPTPLGVQVADVGAGSLLALVGILAAEIHRRETGVGQFVDVSMYDGSLAWNLLPAMTALVTGVDPGRETMRLNGGGYYDFYRTADGRYMSVGSLEPKFLRALCEAVGRPDLVEPGLSGEAAGRQRVKQALRDIFAGRTQEEWMDVFATVDACVEPVLGVSEALQHEQARARDMLVDVPRADGALQRQIANPLKFSRSRPEYRFTGAPVGAHTDAILAEAGYSEAEIQSLRDAGLFGEAP